MQFFLFIFFFFWRLKLSLFGLGLMPMMPCKNVRLAVSDPRVAIVSSRVQQSAVTSKDHTQEWLMQQCYGHAYERKVTTEIWHL